MHAEDGAAEGHTPLARRPSADGTACLVSGCVPALSPGLFVLPFTPLSLSSSALGSVSQVRRGFRFDSVLGANSYPTLSAPLKRQTVCLVGSELS